MFRITKDLPRAKEIYEMVQERVKDIIPILPKDKSYKIIKELNQNQIQLIDKLRKFRHGIVYYGKKVSEGFLANHETEIRTIIAVLNKIVSNKLKKERNWFRTLQILNIQ